MPFWAQSFLLKPLNHSIYLPISAKTRLRSAPTRVDTAEVCDHFGRKRRIVTQYPAAGILNCDQNHLISRIVTQSPATAHPNEPNLRSQPDDKTRYLSRPHWDRSSISGLSYYLLFARGRIISVTTDARSRILSATTDARPNPIRCGLRNRHKRF